MYANPDAAARVMDLYYLSLAVGRPENMKQTSAWRRYLITYLRSRDGDKCGICARTIDFDIKSGPRGSDNGSSIDHVIPVSHGGQTSLANLRLTHWGCNRKRGNRGGNEQLQLIG